MDVIKAQLLDPGAIGKGSPADVTTGVPQERTAATPTSIAPPDRVDIQPLDLAAALKILVLEVQDSLVLTLERAVQASEQPSSARASLGQRSAPTQRTDPQQTPDRPPVAVAVPRDTGILLPATGAATQTGSGVPQQGADSGSNPGSAALRAPVAVSRDAGQFVDAKIVDARIVDAKIVAPRPGPGADSAGNATRIPTLVAAAPLPPATAPPADATGRSIGSVAAVPSRPPIAPRSPSPSYAGVGVGPRALVPDEKPLPLDALPLQRGPPPATSTQAARLVMQFFVRSLPPVDPDPALELAGLQRIEANVSTALERAVATIGAWRNVQETVVNEAEFASVLVQAVLGEDPEAAVWLQTEWPGLAAPMQRFWRRRRIARKRQADPDSPELDPWAEPHKSSDS